LVAVLSACGSSDSSEASGGSSGAGASDGGDASAGTGGASGGSGGSGGTSTGGTSSGGSAGTAGVAGASGGAGQDGGAGSAGAPNDGGSEGAADAGKLTAQSCFEAMFPNASSSGLGLDYDQFNPTIGSHCKGTNHQDIKGVQKVVFLGDSVTVGTPPTNLNPGAVYRAILANKLATLFNIKAPGFGWGAADPINGVALPHESGDFVSCAKWGARTDDLMKDNTQVEDCIPPANRNLHHLVIMTMGGNDIASITQDGGGTNPKKTIPELWAETQSFVQLLRETVQWLKDPKNVPGGVDVVFANNYEFTDATGETNACVLASLGGIEPWQDKQAQADMVIWANEQYMKIATDTKSDMIFMLEAFCGHGYKRDDPTGPCYRGPNTPLWFDVTCIHPNGAGHSALADLFYQTIAE
jgi:lysophospholipase L1-like esterase